MEVARPPKSRAVDGVGFQDFPFRILVYLWFWKHTLKGCVSNFLWSILERISNNAAKQVQGRRVCARCQRQLAEPRFYQTVAAVWPKSTGRSREFHDIQPSIIAIDRMKSHAISPMILHAAYHLTSYHITPSRWCHMCHNILQNVHFLSGWKDLKRYAHSCLISWEEGIGSWWSLLRGFETPYRIMQQSYFSSAHSEFCQILIPMILKQLQVVLVSFNVCLFFVTSSEWSVFCLMFQVLSSTILFYIYRLFKIRSPWQLLFILHF